VRKHGVSTKVKNVDETNQIFHIPVAGSPFHDHSKMELCNYCEDFVLACKNLQHIYSPENGAGVITGRSCLSEEARTLWQRPKTVASS
jgi:hypothetical protein